MKTISEINELEKKMTNEILDKKEKVEWFTNKLDNYLKDLKNYKIYIFLQVIAMLVTSYYLKFGENFIETSILIFVFFVTFCLFRTHSRLNKEYDKTYKSFVEYLDVADEDLASRDAELNQIISGNIEHYKTELDKLGNKNDVDDRLVERINSIKSVKN